MSKSGEHTEIRGGDAIEALLQKAAPRPTPPSEDEKVVRDAVMELPEKAREVVVLHYFVGLSHKDMAALIGASPEVVHGRLVRARRKLACSLRRDGLVGVLDGRLPYPSRWSRYRSPGTVFWQSSVSPIRLVGLSNCQ